MPDSLQFNLHNASESSDIHAYVTGIALQHGGQRCLLRANGKDLYFPASPSAIGSPLGEDCAIPLGPPGSCTSITVPQIAGGRIWFSRDSALTFVLNPGPALVEPSVLNPSDANAATDFAFAEFTLNDAQFYGNISYVDFVPRLPVALSLRTASGATQDVAGMPPNGIETVAAALREQTARDQRPWDKLIVPSKKDGKALRVLNATHGDAVGASFAGYYEPYVSAVWSHYSSPSSSFTINTQAAAGTLSARVQDGKMRIGNEEFDPPSTADILGCNSGPFTTGASADRNAIIPRFAAAFVRSTLLSATQQPSDQSGYYVTSPTNHYARVCHEANADRKGYAFAYDDVQPDGGLDQSGKVNAGDPVALDVFVGGGRLVGGGAARENVQAPVQNGGQREEGGHSGFRQKMGQFAQKVLH